MISKPDFIKSLKSLLNELIDYDKVIERSRHDKVDYENRIFVIPVSFNEHGKELGRSQQFVSKGWVALSSIEHKQMLSHLYLTINEGYLVIPDKYEKLIISLRTAQAKEYSLDKE